MNTVLAALLALLASVGSWGVDLTDRDPSIRPADDLYASQNGSWLARTALNASQPNAAYWRDLRILSAQRLGDLLRTPPPSRSPRNAALARSLYRSFMNEAQIEARGMAPLKERLNAIRAVTSKAAMAKLMGEIEGAQKVRNPAVRIPLGRAMFSLAVGQDPSDPSRYALFVGQSGLQMPGPEYYLDPKLADLKDAYRDYVARMLGLLEWPDASRNATAIVDFETRLAAASWTHEQMTDVLRTHNPMTVAALKKLAPGFDWTAFLRGAGIPANVDRVVIDAKSAFPAIASLYAEAPLSVLQARQAFALIDDVAPLLNASVAAEQFEFRSKRFNGLFQNEPPRELRGEQLVEANLADALSQMYVAAYSSPRIKAKVLDMSENMRRAFDARLIRSSWMSADTRRKARAKLAAMTIKIGYPDRFRKYEGLHIAEDDLFGNVARCAAWNWQADVAMLGRPFDRSRWQLAPGYPQYAYDPTSNSVEIAAATLQPPFFDLAADDAVNYGAIGAVIGQQIVAGFDNRGGRFDAEGRLVDWWNPADRRHLASESARLSQQYSSLEPLPGLHVKGDLVVDEALDDIGGMTIALDAYRASLGGRAAPVLDGFTGDQRFFLGRAQMWRAKFSEAFTRNQLATGQNAPPPIRVNGPSRNLEAFYQAFGVTPDDGMYLPPERRVSVW